jgi:hypothetical protein
MNQRIEKFARECGAWNQVYGNRTFMIDEHFDIEKFAELIVGMYSHGRIFPPSSIRFYRQFRITRIYKKTFRTWP